MLWVLEKGVFNEHTSLKAEIERQGHQWMGPVKAATTVSEEIPRVYRGSIEGSKRSVGSNFGTFDFNCSSYYPKAGKWSLQQPWVQTTVNQFVSLPGPGVYFEAVGASESVFVRPDRPDKEFSGRVVSKVDAPTIGALLKLLDYGVYYDDLNIPIIVSPVRNVGTEYRFVVVDRKVVTGSGYKDNKPGMPLYEDHNPWNYNPWAFAEEIARELDVDAGVYVLDVCRCDDKLFLMELNPFSSADLYNCDPSIVVAAVSEYAARSKANVAV
jgi:hypothetical protein